MGNAGDDTGNVWQSDELIEAATSVAARSADGNLSVTIRVGPAA